MLPFSNHRESECKLILYDEPNFCGRCLVIEQQNTDFSNDPNFDNSVESVKVQGTCLWLMHHNTNFNRDVHKYGQSYLIGPQKYSNFSQWGGTSNQISSARALPPNGTEAIALFLHTNYGGYMVVLQDSQPNLGSINFDHRLSSFIVTGGSWTLYDHANYQGRSSTISGPKQHPHYPSQIGNDQVSSVRKN